MVAALSLQEVLLERPIGDYPDSLDKRLGLERETHYSWSVAHFVPFYQICKSDSSAESFICIGHLDSVVSTYLSPLEGPLDVHKKHSRVGYKL